MRKRETKQMVFDYSSTLDECLKSRIKELDKSIQTQRELYNAVQFVIAVKPFVDPKVYTQLVDPFFSSDNLHSS